MRKQKTNYEFNRNLVDTALNDENESENISK